MFHGQPVKVKVQKTEKGPYAHFVCTDSRRKHDGVTADLGLATERDLDSGVAAIFNGVVVHLARARR